jgi:hypothetical protein
MVSVHAYFYGQNPPNTEREEVRLLRHVPYTRNGTILSNRHQSEHHIYMDRDHLKNI